MDHQHFKSWILDDETLNDEEQSLLVEHLAVCPECAQLKRNLNRALQAIRSAPQMSAPPNFTSRFSASLATRKREEEKHQARALTLALSSSALVIAFGALLIFLPDVSLISFTAGAISTMVNTVEIFQSIVSFITGLFKSINPTSLVLVFVVIGGWILLASITLALSVWKLAVKKVENK